MKKKRLMEKEEIICPKREWVKVFTLDIYIS